MTNIQHCNGSFRAALGTAAMLLLLIALPQTLRADAGTVQVSRGAVSAQSAQGLRLLGARAPVQGGDTISTGRKSFAVVKMNDDTRLVLRPDTEFQIEGWDAEPQRESALIRLVKGGLRAVTGSISKRNPNAWRIRTSVATIGIRGTEFDVRECDADCVIEANKYPAVGSRSSLVVARVGALIGKASALGGGEGAKRRTLTRGGPIYEGDTLTTGKRSYVVVVFADKSRVTLTSRSEFKVETFAYNGGDDDSSFFRLLRGGMRAITGAIGKRNRGATKYAMAAATIGIRGTGFDAICTEEESANPDRPDCYATPWEGSIALELESGDVTLETGDVITLQPGGAPTFLDEMPFELDGPRPDEVEIDDSSFFDTVSSVNSCLSL